MGVKLFMPLFQDDRVLFLINVIPISISMIRQNWFFGVCVCVSVCVCLTGESGGLVDFSPPSRNPFEVPPGGAILKTLDLGIPGVSPPPRRELQGCPNHCHWKGRMLSGGCACLS